jgi:hypothetical protein
MTVSTEVRSVEYEGDDVTTEFPIPFEVLEASHVRVTYYPASGAAVVLTRGVDPGYVVDVTLTAVKDVYPLNGSVPLRPGETIVVERVVPVTQTIDLSNQGTFDAETHEEIADLGVMVDQQLLDRIKALESAGAPGSVLAGNGLEFAGDLVTLHVVPNADGSIVVNANDIQVGEIGDSQHGIRAGNLLHAVATTSVAGFQSAADKTRQDALWARTITAGAGLTGGGDLSANRTLSVVANADGSIVVNADDIQVGVINDTQHGLLSGGALHLTATRVSDGFMSAADKEKLDGLTALNQVSAALVVTSDATPTTLLSFTPADQTSEVVDLLVVGGRKSGGGANGDTGCYRRIFGVKRVDGTTSLVGAVTSDHTTEDAGAGAWDVSVTVVSPAVIIQVTGAAATIVQWSGTATRQVVSRT